MKYALLIYCEEKKTFAMSEAEMGAMFGGYMALDAALGAAKKKLAGEALQPTAAATSVTVRNGKRVVKDGPFAETKEQLGGFYLVEAANLDEAIEWAAKIPGAGYGTVEIRPVWNVDAEMKRD